MLMAKLTDVIADISTGAVNQFTRTKQVVVENFIINQTRRETLNLGITELQDPEQIKARVQNNIQETLTDVLGNDPFFRGRANMFLERTVDTAVKNRLEFFASNPERTVEMLLRNTNNELAGMVFNGDIEYETAVATAIDSINDPKIRKYLNEDQFFKTKEKMLVELAMVAMQTSLDPQTRALIMDQTKEHLSPAKLIKLTKLYEKLNRSSDSYLTQQEFQTAYRKVIANKPLNKKERRSVLANMSQEIIESVRSQPPEQLEKAIDLKMDRLRELLNVEETNSEQVKRLATSALYDESMPAAQRQKVSTLLMEVSTLQSRSDWLSSRMATDSAQTAIEQGYTLPVDINFNDAASVSRGLEQAYANFQYTKHYRGGSTFLDRENISILNTTYNEGNASTRFALVEQLSQLPQDARLALISQLADSNPNMAVAMELKAINPRLSPATMLMYTDVKKGLAQEGSKLPQEKLDLIRAVYANTPEIGNVLASAYASGSEEVREAIIDSIKKNGNLYAGSPVYFSNGKKLNMGAVISIMNLDEMRNAALNSGELYIDGKELSEEGIRCLVPENIGGGGYYLYLSISGKSGRYLTDKAGNKVVISHESLSNAAQPIIKRVKIFF